MDEDQKTAINMTEYSGLRAQPYLCVFVFSPRIVLASASYSAISRARTLELLPTKPMLEIHDDSHSTGLEKEDISPGVGVERTANCRGPGKKRRIEQTQKHDDGKREREIENVCV